MREQKDFMLMNKKLNKDDVYNLSEIDSTRKHTSP